MKLMRLPGEILTISPKYYQFQTEVGFVLINYYFFEENREPILTEPVEQQSPVEAALDWERISQSVLEVNGTSNTQAGITGKRSESETKFTSYFQRYLERRIFSITEKHHNLPMFGR